MKKLIKSTILIIILLLTASVFFACGPKDEEAELRKQGYVCVTLDSLGGRMGTYEKRRIFALPGSLILKPGRVPADLAEPILAGHYGEDWFRGHESEDGSIVYEGEPWDFNSDRVPNEDITLYIRWEASYYYEIRYGENYSLSDKIYVPKSIDTTSFDISLMPLPPDGYTYVDLYEDAEKTKIIDLSLEPLVHPREASQKGITLYARWIEGRYNIVRSAKDLTNLKISENYYLISDIDFISEQVDWVVPDLFRGIIDSEVDPNTGKGHVISGIRVDIQSNAPDYTGMFGMLHDAEIRNVVFSDCEVSVNLGRERPFYVGFLAGRIESAKLHNITLQGSVTVNLTFSKAYVLNVGEVYGFVVDGFEFEEFNVDFAGVSTRTNPYVEPD